MPSLAVQQGGVCVRRNAGRMSTTRPVSGVGASSRRPQPAVRVGLDSEAMAEEDWSLPAPSVEQAVEARAALKHRLLQLAAVTSRGQAAGFSERVDVEDVVMQLEDLCPGPPSASLSGSWRLVYSSVEPFRSSPFFWAFQAAAPSEDLAASVFRFTAGLPVAGSRGPFGLITQRLDVPSNGAEGRLVSEVAMSLFDPFLGMLPGVTGTVVTEARAVADAADPTLLRVTVESTRVTGSNVGIPLPLDALSAPVEAAFAALRGGQPLQVSARTRYADEDLRITRTGEREDQIFVYVRA